MAREVTDATFIAYAEEWNSYPSEREGERRYQKGFKRGQRWGRLNPAWAHHATPADCVAYGRRYRWSPDYIEGLYAGIQSTRPVGTE